jgi:hypothetical protein
MIEFSYPTGNDRRTDQAVSRLGVVTHVADGCNAATNPRSTTPNPIPDLELWVRAPSLKKYEPKPAGRRTDA